MTKLLIRGGRAVSPASKLDAIVDLHVADGVVAAVEKSGGPPPSGFAVVDAAGAIVLPGLVDMGCVVREPGRDDEETLDETLRLAARGGFTTVLALPAVDPPIDTGAAVRHLQARGASAAASSSRGARLLVAGALTRGRRGKELADIGDMALAGAVAFTDAPDPVDDAEVLRRAMEYAASFDKLVIAAGADAALSRGGVVAEGAIATRLGLAGIPAAAETVAVHRHLELARLTGCRAHVGPISTARALALVEAARADGVDVTADAHVWSLLLDEDEHLARPYDPWLRLQPPLRTDVDRDALVEAVRRGALFVSSGHRPSSPRFKDVELALAEPGGSTLSSVLPLLCGRERFGPAEIARALCEGPARALRVDAGRIAVGASADLVVVQTGVVEDVLVDARCAGGPFARTKTASRVRATIVDGRVVE